MKYLNNTQKNRILKAKNSILEFKTNLRELKDRETKIRK